VEFPPHTAVSSDISKTLEIINPDFAGNIYSYDNVVENVVVSDEPEYKLYRTAMLSWDNTARKQNSSHIFHNFSIRRYMQWLSSIVNRVYRSDKYSEDEKIVFVNAWNEWAEGTHLEPDRRYGFAYLKATYDVMKNYVFDGLSAKLTLVSSVSNDVAVIVHLHYVETWPEISAAIKTGFGELAFDLYVTTTSIEGIVAVRNDFPFANVELVENRGRDILPFLSVLESIIHKNYTCAVKIHSKRSIYRDDGELIRSELFGALLDNSEVTRQIIDRFKSRNNLGMLVPRKYLLQHNDLNMTFDEEIVAALSKILGIDFYRDRFPAGSMFWFRAEALFPLQKLKSGAVFEVESGLADGTAAHGVERLFCAITHSEGFEIDIC
jgi:lipopolysaccharide biosynthesis protein